ncbi:MAG: glutamate--tRNA ligase [Candidatus Saccharimonadales bacterium]
MNKANIRVRYAPSPTGLQHPGGVRTALFAWLFARRNSGDFILRIEDTDKAREVKEATDYIYESLRWLGIEWDEGPDKGGEYGPYRQSERLEHYRKYAEELIARDLAYADPFTPAEVEQFRRQSQIEKKAFLFRNFRPESPPKWKEGMPLRFKVPQLKSYAWTDAVRGELSAGAEALDDFVILKSDGYPTYNFANVVDDHLMNISHVLRGEEYISSIPKYLSLYEAFGWEAPINATMPLVLGATGGKKLSKRDGSLPLLEYRKLGYLPDALNNFLATLGWNDGTVQEIYTTAELLEMFTLERLQKAPARFDLERLNYLNGAHIRRLSLAELYPHTQSFWPEGAQKYDDDYRRQVLALVHERLKFFSELPELTSFFFTEPTAPPSFAVEAIDWLKQAHELLVQSDFTEADLESKLRGLAATLELKPGKLFMVLRQAITGSPVAPGLFETLHVLGRDTTISRLERAIAA